MPKYVGKGRFTAKIANRLEEHRLKAQKQQQVLAEQIGISRSTYANLESGTMLPSDWVLDKICEVLELDKKEIYSAVVLEIIRIG